MPLIRFISDGRVVDRVASIVYSLATQVLCAKDVPRGASALFHFILAETPPQSQPGVVTPATPSQRPVTGLTLPSQFKILFITDPQHIRRKMIDTEVLILT